MPGRSLARSDPDRGRQASGPGPGARTTRNCTSRRGRKPSWRYSRWAPRLSAATCSTARCPPSTMPATTSRTSRRGQPPAPLLGVGADRADLDVAVEADPLAGHGHQPIVHPQAHVAAHLDGAGPRTGPARCARSGRASRRRPPGPARWPRGRGDPRRGRRASGAPTPDSSTVHPRRRVDPAGSSTASRPDPPARPSSAHDCAVGMIGQGGERRHLGQEPGGRRRPARADLGEVGQRTGQGVPHGVVERVHTRTLGGAPGRTERVRAAAGRWPPRNGCNEASASYVSWAYG